jgi:hypothetical protein
MKTQVYQDIDVDTLRPYDPWIVRLSATSSVDATSPLVSRNNMYAMYTTRDYIYVLSRYVYDFVPRSQEYFALIVRYKDKFLALDDLTDDNKLTIDDSKLITGDSKLTIFINTDREAVYDQFPEAIIAYLGIFQHVQVLLRDEIEIPMDVHVYEISVDDDCLLPDNYIPVDINDPRINLLSSRILKTYA